MSSNALNDVSNSDSEDSLEPQTSRPNRWQGPASTWRDITKDERGLAATLDTLRDQNLSIHLFNAHSLKRKASEFEEAESSGQEVSQLQDTRRFVPPKVWTAWPLPPDDVPRTGEEIGEEDELEIYTLKKWEKVWPSRELEEVLTAVTMKQAKEIFLGREAEGEPRDKKLVHEESEIAIPIEEEEEFDYNSEESGDPSPTSGQETEKRRSESSTSSQAELETKSLPENSIKLPNPIYEPVISTDDDRSSQLLRPSIRHTLSKLDDVLIALHHARNTCHRYSRSDAGTDDESRAMSVASIASEDGIKRPVGRPRKLQPVRNEPDEPEPPSPTPSQLFRTKKTNIGRPQKVYPRLEGETQQEYLVRIARLQKKPLPSFAPPLETRSRSPSREPRKVPAYRATEEELFVSRNKKLGLRDWSEVMGAAALAGFDSGVIERATQRCAVLFGESMSMRTIVEAPFAESKDITTVYQPELIPDFDEESSSDNSPSSIDREVDDPEIEKEEIPQQKSKVRADPRCCPFRACPRYKTPFRDNYSLQRHLKGVHKTTEPDDFPMEDVDIPSDEEMDGGVHVDGFLRPLKVSFRKSTRSQKKRKRATRNIKTPIGIAMNQSGKISAADSDREEESGSDVENEDSPVEGMDIEDESANDREDEVESDKETNSSPSSSSDSSSSSENE